GLRHARLRRALAGDRARRLVALEAGTAVGVRGARIAVVDALAGAPEHAEVVGRTRKAAAFRTRLAELADLRLGAVDDARNAARDAQVVVHAALRRVV